MADSTEFEAPKVKVPNLVSYATLGRRGGMVPFSALASVYSDRQRPMEERANIAPNERNFLPKVQAVLHDIFKNEKKDKELFEKGEIDENTYEENKRNRQIWYEQVMKSLREYGRNNLNLSEADIDEIELNAKKKAGLFNPNKEEDKLLEERVMLKKEVDRIYPKLNVNVEFQNYLRDLDKAIKAGDTKAEQDIKDIVGNMQKHELIGGDKKKLRAVLEEMHKDPKNELVGDKMHEVIDSLLKVGKGGI